MSRRSSPEAPFGVAAGIAALLAATLLLPCGAGAEVVQKGTLRVAVQGKLTPRKLPRRGAAPVAVTIAGRISTTDASPPPQLRRIELAINRHGRLRWRGLPVCRIGQIKPSTSNDAIKACRRALVGRGSFAANVVLPEQSPFPSRGKVLAFNGSVAGRPAILAHIFGTEPVPTSYVLPFMIGGGRGAFGTTLSASLPQVTSEWGFVTGISMRLSRSFRHRGARHSYLSAGCPAPAGFPGAVFPLVRASFAFSGRRTLSSTLTRGCRVRR